MQQLTNHSEAVCTSKPPPKPVTENAVFDQVCYISTHGAKKYRTLDHHIFNSTSDRWEKRQSLPQTRRLVARLHPDDYVNLRLPQRPRRTEIDIEGMADTGCQSCLVGTHILQKLGISKVDLIPVTQKMQAANKSGIHILGAILLEFSLNGAKPSTKQMVYVTPNVTRLFLCREACSELGIIPKSFPSTMVGASSSIVLPEKKADPTKQDTKRPCTCPAHSLPPPGPIPLPVPATEANRGILEAHLRAIFKASTFNTCNHQTSPYDGRSTPETEHRPRGHTCNGTQSGIHTRALGRQSEGAPGP